MGKGSGSPPPLRGLDAGFLQDMQLDVSRMGDDLGCDVTIDLAFLAFLRRMSRFGYFTFGPIAIDVRLIEDIVERTAPRVAPIGPDGRRFADDFVRLTQVLMAEVQRSGRRRIDELHFLLAFMRVGEGLPSRVFAELGVSPEDVERFARHGNQPVQGGQLEKLFSPEEAADYLGVHVQTVRAWIRSGRLPARRLAGQRALRIRASDLECVLEPVSAGEE